MGKLARHLPPPRDVGDEIAEAPARLCGELVAVEQGRGRQQERMLRRAGVAVEGSHRLVAKASLRLVDDPLEREIIGRLDDQAEVGDRIPNLSTLIKTE